MMAAAAVIGLTPGKRLITSSFYHCSDPSEKLSYCAATTDHGPSSRGSVVARSSNSNYGHGYHPASKPSAKHSVKALKDHVVDTSSWLEDALNDFEQELEEEDGEEGEESFDLDVEALLLLQKSLLEKQWNISFERTDERGGGNKERGVPVTGSGVSARERRVERKRKGVIRREESTVGTNGAIMEMESGLATDLLHSRSGGGGYVNGVVSAELLTHAEILRLSKIIKAGLSLDEYKSRLRERLGCDPSDEQLSDSLKISRSELRSKQMAFSLAREKLAMSNIRLVMSIAQKYNKMGAELGDLVQGGLIGLLRGIEKYDPSKGFKMSTYVYWWIRQGVARAYAENLRTFRLPNHLHGRISLVRNAKIKLQEEGIEPTIDKIAEALNMSERKVRTATEADDKAIMVVTRDAHPSLNGLPGTPRQYIDDEPENVPWHGVDESAVKDEVNKLIDSTLRAREREIIRLYHGIDCGKCFTWEEISKHIGLSRERVRQVGLVAFEKLKLAARRRKMDALLPKH